MDDITKINQIKHIREAAGRERDKLDKIIFAVTAGTLSLSITFITNASHNFIGKKYLFASWGVLIGGLVIILLGYTSAILHCRWCEKKIKKDALSNPDQMEENFWFTLVEIFNWLSLLAPVVGIGLFAYFGYLNLNG